jgi:hypothetical protein
VILAIHDSGKIMAGLPPFGDGGGPMRMIIKPVRDLQLLSRK